MTGKQVAVVTDSPRCTMGSFRRSRPRFMSSPVLSDLSRFHARTDTPPACASAIWNSIQSAVMKIFRGGALQPNELYTLNENIRWLLKSEMGSFVTDYFQNRLLSGGLTELARRIFISGGERLAAVAEAWRRFFTETLPTLQAIFYPIQGVRERGAASSSRYRHLERLAATVVSPYLEDELRPSECDGGPPRSLGDGSRADTCSSLAPLAEQEGEAYLEKAGGARRHTVADAHSDACLLAGRMRRGTEARGGGPARTAGHLCGRPDVKDSRR
ncbi:proline-rich protein 5-like isoform X7 [Phyllopteryx taeniolatus]|uniref:proline-rich protein 5-like isoform X7 n=1 Tax=Phyllopteryx taeniolatus TaxID=161469 RepID=UPI002AD450F1|nr:proline-rich protein 5-like isoform X7 [Phyllopteryx taeniolatus]